MRVFVKFGAVLLVQAVVALPMSASFDVQAGEATEPGYNDSLIISCDEWFPWPWCVTGE